MVIILGHWDISYHAPITEQYYWNLPLRDFEVDQWIMSPYSGIKNTENRVIPLQEYDSSREALDKIDKTLKRVFVEPINPKQGVEESDIIWLHEFQHPEDCVYIFGSAHFNPTSLKRKQDVIVTIKTKQDKGVLWGHQCACIVLYDRYLKNGSYNSR